MSPQQIAQRKGEVMALATKLSEAADGAEHAMLLEALLALYMTVADHHSCCTASAVRAMAIGSARLAKGLHDRPANAPVH